jgi:hypothetical protein
MHLDTDAFASKPTTTRANQNFHTETIDYQLVRYRFFRVYALEQNRSTKDGCSSLIMQMQCDLHADAFGIDLISAHS